MKLGEGGGGATGGSVGGAELAVRGRVLEVSEGVLEGVGGMGGRGWGVDVGVLGGKRPLHAEREVRLLM